MKQWMKCVSNETWWGFVSDSSGHIMDPMITLKDHITEEDYVSILAGQIHLRLIPNGSAVFQVDRIPVHTGCIIQD